mgnify:CR=1 FL=1
MHLEITLSKLLKILYFFPQAENEFKEILFLSFEQTKDKNIARLLGIDYWTTIVIYKNYKEISITIGQTNKSEIFKAIKAS